MKKYFKILTVNLFVIVCAFFYIGCGVNWENPGVSLGGGGTATEIPTASNTTVISNIETTTSQITSSSLSTTLSGDETSITGATEITTAGNYVLSGNIDLGTGQIKVSAENVVLYLNGVTISKTTAKKVINAKVSTTIVIVSNTINSISTSYADTDAIGSDADLTIVGGGTLYVTATDDAISADGVLSIFGGTITATATAGHAIRGDSVILKNTSITTTSADKDGIHAESDYEEVLTAPVFSFEKGYVYVSNSNLTLTTTSGGDGIQADSFIQIVSGTFNITTNNGAPTTGTESSSDLAEGKAIKAGLIDYTLSTDAETELELESENYAVYIQDGTFNINSNDDAIHSNGCMFIVGGDYTIATGDDGFHSDNLLKISGGEISISKCYEGIESAKVEISGGIINVVSADDGINAADGTTNTVNQSNSNCYIIISGGTINVNASGDGIDSNGTMLMSGGTVAVCGSTANDNGALDSDGGIIINGGYLFAVGSLGMVETPTTNSTQKIVSFATYTTISAGTNLYLTDSSANVIFNMLTSKSCQSVIISCPELTTGQTYNIYGGSTKLVTFSVSSTITTVGSSSSSNDPSGMPIRR